MEKRVIKSLDEFKNRDVEMMGYLSYHLENDEKRKGYSLLTFTREDNISNKEAKDALEKKYLDRFNILPLFIFFLLIFLAIACFTALLVCNLALKNQISGEDRKLLSLFLSLPGALTLFGATIYFYFRYVSINKFLDNEKSKDSLLEEAKKLQ